MPYKNPEDRKYTKAAKAYDSSEEVMAKRRARNRARYKLMKEGKVAVGDGKDVDHITPLSKGGAATDGKNLRAVPKGDNRSFSRNSDHSVKSNKPKKK